MIKRSAPLLAVVATLALASFAWADAEQWAGSFDDRGTVAFKLTIPGKGEQRTVKRWEWANFKLRCSNGKHRYDGNFFRLDPVIVNPIDRNFTIKAVNSWGGKAVVHGIFDKAYSQAEGTFKVRGRTNVGRRCRGESNWTASGPPVT